MLFSPCEQDRHQMPLLILSESERVDFKFAQARLKLETKFGDEP